MTKESTFSPLNRHQLCESIAISSVYVQDPVLHKHALLTLYSIQLLLYSHCKSLGGDWSTSRNQTQSMRGSGIRQLNLTRLFAKEQLPSLKISTAAKSLNSLTHSPFVSANFHLTRTQTLQLISHYDYQLSWKVTKPKGRKSRRTRRGKVHKQNQTARVEYMKLK